MKKRILITGGSGFIGKNLKEQLSDRYTISAPTSRELDLQNSVHVEQYLIRGKFDTVIHSATHNATATSTKDVSKVFTANVRMFMNLARCQSQYRRMIYFGSAAEYHKEKMPKNVKEEFFDAYVPETEYGFSKYIMSMHATRASNIIDLRLFGVYGKYEDWRIRFISNAITRILRGQDILMHQNVLFDYMYIDDVTRIVDWFIQQKTLKHHHYNVCTGIGVDLKTIAKTILKISKSDKKIIIERSGNKRPFVGDNSRLKKEMQGFAFTSIESGVSSVYAWYKEHKKLYES